MAVARPPRRLQRWKRNPYLQVSISIKMAKPSQAPVTSIVISGKHAKIRTTTSREGRKKNGEMAEHHETMRPKERTAGPPRGVRKRRARRQRRRVSFTIPNQPLPPFFLFMAQHRPKLQKSNPHWTAVKTVMRLGKMWHNQPERDKEMYKEQAAWLRRRKETTA